jgi:TrmH family RNA methyltransferase
VQQRAYLVEGVTLVAEALAAEVPLEGIYAEPGAPAALLDAAAAAAVPVLPVAEGVLARTLSTMTPQPVVAVAAQPSLTLDAALRSAEASGLVLVLVDVADPGNAGTLLRSAEAAGAGAVLFCEGTVDPYAPKCVRASAGSVFHVGVVSGGDPVGVLAAVEAGGWCRVAAAPRDGEPYDEFPVEAPVALVLGGEARGLPPAVDALVDRRVTIPMAGRAESLNVAMAGTLLAFEVARRRRAVAPDGPR